ncbi:MAG: CHRD domain-containing protein [Planctomycetota bacterium]
MPATSSEELLDDITTNEGGALNAAGSITVDAAAIEALQSEGLYFNLHTSLNPAGEIRGQIVL